MRRLALALLALTAGVWGCRSPAALPVGPPGVAVRPDEPTPGGCHRPRADAIRAIYVLFADREGIGVSGGRVPTFEGALVLERDGMAYPSAGFAGQALLTGPGMVDPEQFRFQTEVGIVDGSGRFAPTHDQLRAAREGFLIEAFPEGAPEVRAQRIYKPFFGRNAILRFDGAPGTKGRPGHAGRRGYDGADGRDGRNGGSGEWGGDGQDGWSGGGGTNGGSGGDGGRGGDAPNVRVLVTPLTSPFYDDSLIDVYAEAANGRKGHVVLLQGQDFLITADGGPGGRGGAGGPGGDGGDGGAGGDAGNGGDGVDADYPGGDGGDGGNGGEGGLGGDGGRGGNGGRGGDGGDGGAAGRITVLYALGELRDEVRRHLQFSVQGGPGGEPGEAGPAGPGGSGGPGGRGGRPGRGGRGGPVVVRRVRERDTGEASRRVVGPPGEPGESGLPGSDGWDGSPGRSGETGAAGRHAGDPGPDGTIAVRTTGEDAG